MARGLFQPRPRLASGPHTIVKACTSSQREISVADITQRTRSGLYDVLRALPRNASRAIILGNFSVSDATFRVLPVYS